MKPIIPVFSQSTALQNSNVDDLGLGLYTGCKTCGIRSCHLISRQQEVNILLRISTAKKKSTDLSL